jgi:hypothetical protein
MIVEMYSMPIVAQDMAKVAPNNVKVLLENDQARVLDVQYKTGAKLPMHSHPANIVYAMRGAKVRTTLADGKCLENRHFTRRATNRSLQEEGSDVSGLSLYRVIRLL